MGRLHKPDFSGFAETAPQHPMKKELQNTPDSAKGDISIALAQSTDPFFTGRQIEFVLSQLTTFKASVEEARDREFDSLFLWLCGEEGDFPNLAEKPHYRFRTELRERLKKINYKYPTHN